MLYSYENRKNKFAIDFSSPRLRRTNTCNFTSGCVQNRARLETGDSGPVTSIQERCFRGFQCFSCATTQNSTMFSSLYACIDKKDENKGIYMHQITLYGDTRSEAVKRKRKWISYVNGNRKHFTPSKYSVVCDVVCSMHRKEDFTRTYSFKNIQLEIVVCIAVR